MEEYLSTPILPHYTLAGMAYKPRNQSRDAFRKKFAKLPRFLFFMREGSYSLEKKIGKGEGKKVFSATIDDEEIRVFPTKEETEKVIDERAGEASMVVIIRLAYNEPEDLE